MEKYNIDEIISLGHFCQSAQFIKDINKHNVSYPFDWCVSNNYIINECLKDDFRIFMNKKYHISNSPSISSGHIKYNRVFFHHKNINHIYSNKYTKNIIKDDKYNNIIYVNYYSNSFNTGNYFLNKSDNNFYSKIILELFNIK